MDAAERLDKEGVSAETRAPLTDGDPQTVKKTNRVLVLHEFARTGGIGGRWPLLQRKLNGSTRRWSGWRHRHTGALFTAAGRLLAPDQTSSMPRERRLTSVG
jgi:hypothetical protein